MLLRFLVFAGYESNGGWNDYQSCHEGLADAIEQAKTLEKTEKYIWWHVVDIITRKVVRGKYD